MFHSHFVHKCFILSVQDELRLHHHHLTTVTALSAVTWFSKYLNLHHSSPVTCSVSQTRTVDIICALCPDLIFSPLLDRSLKQLYVLRLGGFTDRRTFSSLVWLYLKCRHSFFNDQQKKIISSLEIKPILSFLTKKQYNPCCIDEW